MFCMSSCSRAVCEITKRVENVKVATTSKKKRMNPKGARTRPEVALAVEEAVVAFAGDLRGGIQRKDKRTSVRKKYSTRENRVTR